MKLISMFHLYVLLTPRMILLDPMGSYIFADFRIASQVDTRCVNMQIYATYAERAKKAKKRSRKYGKQMTSLNL